MKCQFCEEPTEIKPWDAEIVEHLILTEDRSGHMHTHGPVDNPGQMRKFSEAIRKYDKKRKKKDESLSVGFSESSSAQAPLEERKIIFRHHRAAGDDLMFTSGVRDFKLLFPEIRLNVDTTFPHFWENNPYLDRTLKKDDPGVEYYAVGYPTIQTCNNGMIHYAMGFLLDMIAMVDLHRPLPLSLGEFTAAFANGAVGDPDLGDAKKNPHAREPFVSLKKRFGGFCKDFARQRCDIHLSEEERKRNPIKEAYGVEKYWVVAPGGKSDCTCKIWDWRRFQKVVNHFDGLIKFVSIGRSDHILDKLDNVIDMTDKTNLRQLVHIVHHAEGVVTGVSLMAHLAAGVPTRYDDDRRRACVQIFGGREPTSYTWYCNHQLLHVNGALQCARAGGCWQSRVIPLSNREEGNKRLCHDPVKCDGRTIPRCMDMITADDVIRAIERYYEGGFYEYFKGKGKIAKHGRSLENPLPNKGKGVHKPHRRRADKEINVLASMQSKGGGEQSAAHIVKLLRGDGWTVHFWPWDKVHKNYADIEMETASFKDGMVEKMKEGLPLLFYANDQIWDFCKDAQGIVEKSSDVVIGINWMNGTLPKTNWIQEKLKAIIWQNREAKANFEREAVGFENTERVVLFGAIDLEPFLEVKMRRRQKGEQLVILKQCTPDYRKYVTAESEGNGSKPHLYQKHFHKYKDTRFYKRLLNESKLNLRFEFMVAHPELEKEFGEDTNHFKFWKWDEIPVTEFLGRGHVFLYRTADLWVDNYPRVMAEALAAGLPVLGEPRDGPYDRIWHSETGLYAIDFDAYLYGVKLYHRKEDYRYASGLKAKSWSKDNLDPKEWVRTINRILSK